VRPLAVAEAKRNVRLEDRVGCVRQIGGAGREVVLGDADDAREVAKHLQGRPARAALDARDVRRAAAVEHEVALCQAGGPACVADPDADGARVVDVVGRSPRHGLTIGDGERGAVTASGDGAAGGRLRPDRVVAHEEGEHDTEGHESQKRKVPLHRAVLSFGCLTARPGSWNLRNRATRGSFLQARRTLAARKAVRCR
jgi:hypothetical protein